MTSPPGIAFTAQHVPVLLWRQCDARYIFIKRGVELITTGGNFTSTRGGKSTRLTMSENATDVCHQVCWLRFYIMIFISIFKMNEHYAK